MQGQPAQSVLSVSVNQISTLIFNHSTRLDEVAALSDAISGWRSWDDIEVTMEAQIVLGED